MPGAGSDLPAAPSTKKNCERCKGQRDGTDPARQTTAYLERRVLTAGHVVIVGARGPIPRKRLVIAPLPIVAPSAHTHEAKRARAAHTSQPKPGRNTHKRLVGSPQQRQPHHQRRRSLIRRVSAR